MRPVGPVAAAWPVAQPLAAAVVVGVPAWQERAVAAPLLFAERQEGLAAAAWPVVRPLAAAVVVGVAFWQGRSVAAPLLFAEQQARPADVAATVFVF